MQPQEQSEENIFVSQDENLKDVPLSLLSNSSPVTDQIDFLIRMFILFVGSWGYALTLK